MLTHSVLHTDLISDELRQNANSFSAAHRPHIGWVESVSVLALRQNANSFSAAHWPHIGWVESVSVLALRQNANSFSAAHRPHIGWVESVSVETHRRSLTDGTAEARYTSVDFLPLWSSSNNVVIKIVIIIRYISIAQVHSMPQVIHRYIWSQQTVPLISCVVSCEWSGDVDRWRSVWLWSNVPASSDQVSTSDEEGGRVPRAVHGDGERTPAQTDWCWWLGK